MFKPIELLEERQLEAHVKNNIECLEQGLKYLAHQKPANGKFIDVLAVDQDGVLVIIELKITQDDQMLFQALEYYDYVSSNRDRLAREYDEKIELQENPRIVLVAPGFSERLRRAVRYFEPQTKLLEYSYLESKSGEKGLFCKEISFDSENAFVSPVSLDSAVSYITDLKLRALCHEVHKQILSLGHEVEFIPHNAYIRYKCRNRVLGDIVLRRAWFVVWWVIKGDDWGKAKVTKASEWAKNR